MTELKRTLGLPALLTYGVGVIVGAGIYSIVGAGAGAAGRLLWLSFVLAAIPAALAALCYAELIGMYPRAGAEYVFVEQAWPKRRAAAFAIGFVVVMTNAATSATVSLAFGGYLAALTGVPGWAGAALLLGACTLVNVVGIQASARVTALCTAAEILGLVLIVGGGVASGRFGEGVLVAPHAGVLGGAALIFFVYTGFEGIANLAEEAERPRRDLPRALLWSGAITTAFYVAVAIAVVALVEPEALAQSDAPLATAGGAAAPWLAGALAGIALFSTGNTALITLVVASRLLFAMARAGDMPPLFARLLPGRQTPWLAALAMLAAAGSLVPLGEVALVGSVSSLSTLVAFAVVASAVIALRRRDPGRARPFRIPFAVAGVPVPAALAIAAVGLLATRFPPAAYAVVAAGFGIGALLHLSRGWWSRS